MIRHRGLAVAVGLLVGGGAAMSLPSVGAISYPNESPGARQVHVLQVVISGGGSGTVRSAPLGIECDAGPPQGCEKQFVDGTSILLVAEAKPGSTVASWSDCPEPSPNECRLVLESDMVVGVSIIPTPPRASKTLQLLAKPTTVKKGNNTNLTGVITPCTPATQNDVVVFMVGGKVVGSLPVSPTCEADLAWRVRRSSVFTAMSGGDADSLTAESNQVKVKVKKRR